MLSMTEGRVLGCLLEKERTVPDQYPLTLSALVAACNQSTSRSPVMTLTAHDVESAATALKEHRLVRLVHPAHGSRVVRYRQVLVDTLALSDDEACVVTVLLLRGPHTAAEVRQHGERLHTFGSVEQVTRVLEQLAERGEPLVRRLDRSPGHKGERWQQIIAEEASVPQVEAPVASPSLAARVAELEERVERLEAALRDLL